MTHTYMTESITELASFLYDDLKKKNHLYGMQSSSEKIRKGALLVHKEVSLGCCLLFRHRRRLSALSFLSYT